VRRLGGAPNSSCVSLPLLHVRRGRRGGNCTQSDCDREEALLDLNSRPNRQPRSSDLQGIRRPIHQHAKDHRGDEAVCGAAGRKLRRRELQLALSRHVQEDSRTREDHRHPAEDVEGQRNDRRIRGCQPRARAREQIAATERVTARSVAVPTHAPNAPKQSGRQPGGPWVPEVS
jgi:hypothetical protein